jgi:dTDP-4-dehydrorhamnose 3,5-epimerase
MKIINVTPLAIPEIKVIKLQRFVDNRGYFLEVFRTDILTNHSQLPQLKSNQFIQLNESHSTRGVARGLHTQCRPNIDKLLRILKGKIIDVAVDIRPGSPTFGKAVAYELSYRADASYEEIIFIPFGFAHGILALQNSHIQYFQTGLWNNEGEKTIQFTDETIDWTLCQKPLQKRIRRILDKSIFSDKDKRGETLAKWQKDLLAQDYHFTLLDYQQSGQG